MKLSLPLILASNSPRRRELLRLAGIEFQGMGAEGVVESHDPSLTGPALTVLNARAKAEAIAQAYPEALVMGADTLVYLDNAPLGKPASLAEAAAMLGLLSGRAHQVCTGVSLCWAAGRKSYDFHDVTTVTFRPLSSALIGEYLSLVPVLDKAGAYALQERGELIVESVVGSRSNVVGLPMEKTLAALGRWSLGTSPPAWQDVL